MKTVWDYTNLADAYIKRADYAPEAIQRIFEISNLKEGDKVCDVGAGVAHLTIPLAKFGCAVDAVEPNEAMRKNGKLRTSNFSNVKWSEGCGENTGCESNAYDLVTFGSSFNVCDRQEALKEAYRILKSRGYFTCLWNHRNLEDPIQKECESIIKNFLPDYTYGTRREDQTEVIAALGLFDKAVKFESPVIHPQPVEETIEAWKSHATLQRQAGGYFEKIINSLEAYLISLNQPVINVPYITRVWVAQRKD